MFGFGFGFGLGLLEVDQGPRQALEVSWPPDTAHPQAALPVVVSSTHIYDLLFCSVNRPEKETKEHHTLFNERANYC
jgi:hypothetical protein